MANTIDQMQDVFPVAFDFVKGEQPTAIKLTGWVKQTDTAFARMTKAVGDPWEYTAHSSTSGAYFLSPDRLAQASLARIIGPSDYVSPRGGSFQEAVASVTVSLPAYRNTWNVGFPLVKLTSDMLPSDAGMSKISKLMWTSEIVATVAPSGLFTTEVAAADLVQSTGQFYVDYYTGSITTYDVATSAITLTISNLHMLGPGVPWGTSNIIPHWNSSTTLCWVTQVSTGSGTTLYNVALPTVVSGSRDTGLGNSLLGAVADADTSVANIPQWGVPISGGTAQYRMPVSLTNNLSTGDLIPDGFMYVWDESTGRIVPQTEFIYQDATNVRVQTPTGWLTEGGTVRLILTGTSLAEAVHHLMSVQREGRHLGLSTGQHQDTLHYMVPISHHDLVDSFSGSIPSSTTEPTKYCYRESSYPINPHPQYIHRAGYMEDDEAGNSGNAMRGWLGFAGRYDVDSTYKLGAGTSAGTMGATYGLIFGGGTTTSVSRNSSLSWEGGVNVDTWTSDSAYADKLGFGIDELGAQRMGDERYGALTYTPWYGMPLYIQGASGRGDDAYIGGVLGMDMGVRNEMNYIKLEVAARSGSYDVPNQPCYSSQSGTTKLDITPGLTFSTVCNRLSPEQIREFRFRGGSWNERVRNANDGLGGTDAAKTFDTSTSHDCTMASAAGYYRINGNYAVHYRVGETITNAGFASSTNNGTKTVTGLGETGSYTYIYVSGTVVTEASPTGATITSNVNEFNAYFTSPGMVGADFINVYSNAIFFSDTGTGKTTSFTDRGETWMNTVAAGSEPSGLYFFPDGATIGKPYLAFTAYDSTVGSSTTPFEVGDRWGLNYSSANGGNVSIQSTAGTALFNMLSITLISSLNLNLTTTSSGDINLTAADDVSIVAADNMSLTAADDISISATGTGSSEGMIDLYGNRHIHLYTNSSPTFTPGNGGIMIEAEGSAITHAVAGWDIYAGSTPYSSNQSSQLYGRSDSITALVEDSGGSTQAFFTISDTHMTLRTYNGDITLTASSEIVSSTIYGNTGSGTSVVVNSSGYLRRSSSSRKHKENIAQLEDTSWIYDLSPVSFNYKSDSASTIQYGLIAEDTEEICKDIIAYNKQGEPDNVYYNSLFTAMLKELQILRTRVNELESQLEE
jgi:hypothetical protein